MASVALKNVAVSAPVSAPVVKTVSALDYADKYATVSALADAILSGDIPVSVEVKEAKTILEKREAAALSSINYSTDRKAIGVTNVGLDKEGKPVMRTEYIGEYSADTILANLDKFREILAHGKNNGILSFARQPKGSKITLTKDKARVKK